MFKSLWTLFSLNPFLYLGKYDLKLDPIFTQVLKLDEGNSIKQTKKRHLFVENDTNILWQSMWTRAFSNSYTEQ